MASSYKYKFIHNVFFFCPFNTKGSLQQSHCQLQLCQLCSRTRGVGREDAIAIVPGKEGGGWTRRCQWLRFRFEVQGAIGVWESDWIWTQFYRVNGSCSQYGGPAKERKTWRMMEAAILIFLRKL